MSNKTNSVQAQQAAERPEEKRRVDSSERRKAQAASQPSYSGERANRLYQEMGAKNAGKMLDEIV